MRKAILTTAMGAALLAAAPATVWAHHSHAMFDTSKVVTTMGTVAGYDYSNPHVYIYLMVPDKAGKTSLFTVESPPPQIMSRDGIENATFKKGDTVTMSVNPWRSGQPGGYYLGAVDAKGDKHGSLAPEHRNRPAVD
jgi:hypothetical protein